ncbi:MAG: DNA-3-methyladenine glycosylase 2 family protein [Deltaproteobacteria bacterium]|nr:DNA-3-methyladenine glycosylase 2 family protein [Deltaproteobacteria bacterium]
MTSRIRIKHFSLRDTLECGQFFRFTKAIDTYIVHSSGRIFSLFQKGDFLFYDGIDETFLRDFFRLEDDLETILREIDCDSIIHLAIQKQQGLRLIRQDPWECLFSFLCSSAKAIPHIRTMIELLCKSSGEKVTHGDYVGYCFPEPQSIKNGFQLESIKAGFRTHYLVNANQCIDRNQLVELKNLSYQDAKKRLMTISGVGKKVADCVLLYSLDFLEAFPIDTWIKKGLQKAYFNGEKVGEKKMEEFVRNHFGPYAGYAQLYLYHYWRNQEFS